jgi:2-polyprenyl-6-methoxyphenol hydroxylase-like FAD-dependent oxidoreductase
MDIAIIGGGIGGLTTALALRRFGFEPQVFEQAPQLLEVGAAIAMWPNALRVLQRLGVGETVIDRAGLIAAVCWRSSGGKVLNCARLPIKNVPAAALHRADLHSTLLHALPEHTIHLGHTFQEYKNDGNKIRISFSEHHTINCDVLIGADGLHSRVREQLLDDSPPVFRGYTVWRGVTDCQPTELQSGFAVEVQGRGQRFGIGPVGLGRLGWWASANEKTTSGTPELEDQARLMDLFAGWWAPVVQLIEETAPAAILRTPAFDRSSTRTWGNGRMTLLGDAIHPTTPNLGQGGCMAVEDALVLARCLAKYADASLALRRYEALRQARTSALATYSRLYGSVGQWESHFGVLLRSVALSLVPEIVAKRLLGLIFDYDAYEVPI